jgi:hypothetical protein
MTTIATRVPRDFEDWRDREHHKTSPPRTCDQCGAPDARWEHDGGTVYCKPCLRYQYGYDQAEEHAARALLGGAVKTALGECVSPALIRDVVEQAIDEYATQEVRAMREGMMRAGDWPADRMAEALAEVEAHWRGD